MDKKLGQEVRKRANDACEYCKLRTAVSAARFHIEHIVARKHGGDDSLDNLGLACYRCNLYKGPNLSGIDPVTGNLERLFHPRGDAWSEHFEWSRSVLMGRTSVGRATIAVLRINHPDLLALRESLLSEGVSFAVQ